MEAPNSFLNILEARRYSRGKSGEHDDSASNLDSLHRNHGTEYDFPGAWPEVQRHSQVREIDSRIDGGEWLAVVGRETIRRDNGSVLLESSQKTSGCLWQSGTISV
jgi:hypothetical protein